MHKPAVIVSMSEKDRNKQDRTKNQSWFYKLLNHGGVLGLFTYLTFLQNCTRQSQLGHYHLSLKLHISVSRLFNLDSSIMPQLAVAASHGARFRGSDGNSLIVRGIL